MSYAGPALRSRGAAQNPARPVPSAVPPRPEALSPTPDESADPHETDWQQVIVFGAGLALGLALGAGAALLTAPQTGEETRAALKGRVRRIKRTAGRRGRDAWSDLGEELHSASLALRRRKARRNADRALRRELDREASRRLASD